MTDFQELMREIEHEALYGSCRQQMAYLAGTRTPSWFDRMVELYVIQLQTLDLRDEATKPEFLQALKEYGIPCGS